MATFTGTAGNDSWVLVNPGTFTLDGLGGVDSLSLGTSLRSSYTITQAADGSVHVDSVSGASGVLHATLLHMEILTFNSDRDTLNLLTYFGGTTTPAPVLAPTVSIVDNTTGTAIGNVSYSLTFNTAVTGLSAASFTVSNGSVASISGSGTGYVVVVAPSANTEGSLGLTLNAGSVSNASGVFNAASSTAVVQAIDTRPPTLNAITPTDKAVAVAVNTNVVVTFSEAIQKGTGSLTLKDGSGATVAVYDAATSASLSITGATLTIHPAAPLANGTTYTLDFAAGSIKDMAGNAFAGSTGYGFLTALDSLKPSLKGGTGDDSFSVIPGTESIDGLGGVNTVVLPALRAAYTVTQSASGFGVVAKDGSGNYTLANIQRVQFSDLTINTSTSADAKTLPTTTLHALEELYVAFFNRIPDSSGLDYWIGQSRAGVSLDAVASAFYSAAVQFSSTTGYSASMTNDAFVQIIYQNVLGRSGATAPSAADVQYWSSQLQSGAATKGSLVSTMLSAAHSYKGDATYGWVANLLDNKVSVADYAAVQQGISYNVANDAVVKGMAISAAITATDTSAAITLVGVPVSVSA